MNGVARYRQLRMMLQVLELIFSTDQDLVTDMNV